MLVVKRVECSPFALPSAFILKEPAHVDSHSRILWQAHGFHFGDVPASLHVCRITTSTENDGNLGVGIDVV